MMKQGKVKILMAGVGGYGAYNLQELTDYADPALYELEGVVEPYPESSSRYQWLLDNRIPIYSSLEEFYSAHTADLAVLTTPIHLHKSQCIAAMEHGSHVLCEKPLVPVLQDAQELRAACERTGKHLGVGFQWSFCTPILNLKRDILSGALGRPLSMACYISWPRYDSYYEQGGWKGRLRDSAGNWILDSVCTNATAHYLHNLFFLMGDELSASATPAQVDCALYRGKEIESFDTCFVRGRFENDCRFYFIATHSGESTHHPSFVYEFEKATVEMRPATPHDLDAQIIAKFRDGTVRDYGNAQSDESKAEKLTVMIDVARGKESSAPCGIDTILPHLLVCNALFDQVEIAEFPAAMRYRTAEPAGSFVRDLAQQCEKCITEDKLPSDLRLPWAVPETRLQLEGYSAFSGERFAPR